MKCSNCGHDNPAGQKFCGECGARLEAVCTACQSKNPPGQKFCGECGTPLAPAPAPVAPVAVTAAPTATPVVETSTARAADRFASPDAYTPKHLADKILTSRGAVEGERKVVTVMFADVSGFTAMSERLDPEDVHGIMDRVFEVILAAVHQYEGTVNQFLGDGVMALFGAPIAHEDHAHRALSAALDIQKGLVPVAEDVRRVHSVDFRMRMGLNTGPVVVGAIGKDLRMDYTAVGDTTNLAARLLALAKPGQIVVSQRTHHMRERFFTFEDLGEHAVKGKTEPVHAFAVTGMIQGRTRLEVSKERGLTPLVGRDAELTALMEAYRRAATGHGSALLLVGDPGSGKSRLLYEFLHGLDAEAPVELETICVSYGRTIPYRPILELLRRHLRLTEAMPADEVRKRVAEQLHLLELAGEERLVLLAHFLGVSAPPEFLRRLSAAELKERSFALLREVFVGISQSTPLILVIENMHWVDAASLEFLAHLAAELPAHRILLMMSARPGFAAPWISPGETLTLHVLGRDHMDSMIRALLGAGTISPPLAALLVDKGGGNPLYVEELVLQLRETGGIVVEGGEARLGSTDVRVPATIQDIIAARVDRLADRLKLALQGAAVIGRRFGVSLLSRVVVVPPDDAGVRLVELHGVDFVFPAAQDPELMYSFKHALTQDVVYAGLLERRRRQYHRAAGLGLEQLYADRLDDVVELLVYHFGRSGDDEKAVDYGLAAAEKAQRRWANTEALAFFDDVLKRLASMPDNEANRLRRLDAVVKQAELMFALGRHAEHVQALDAIRDLVDATADAPRRAAWYYWTGFLHSLTGARPDLSIEYCQTAVKIAGEAGLDEIRASADSCLGQVYAYAGRLGEALDAGERALAVFEALGNVWWTCRTLWGLSLTAIPMGDWPRSLEYCRRALAHGQAVNDRRLLVVGWWRSGWTHIQRGDAATGIECCEKALGLSPSPFDAAMARASKGYGLVKLGKGDEGIAMLRDAVDWFERSRLAFTRTWYAIWLADSYLQTGDYARARSLAEDVLDKSRASGYRYFEGLAQRLLGTALVHEDAPAAAGHLEAALDFLEKAGVRNDVAKVFVAQAELRRAENDLTGARELLEQARDMFVALGTIDEPPRVDALLARLG